MFIEQVRQSLIEQAHRWAQQINHANEQEYLAAIQNWARNNGQGGEPKPAFSVVPKIDFNDDVVVRIVTTDRPVSAANAKDFLPVYGTDKDAVGGEVGGPIPDQPGRYYATSNANPYLGKEVEVGTRKFKFVANGLMSRFWQEQVNPVG